MKFNGLISGTLANIVVHINVLISVHCVLSSNCCLWFVSGDRDKPIDYDVYRQGDDVCVECNSTCVVIIHANVTSLNSSYLSLHSVRVLNKPTDNDTVVECIPDITLDDYQIGIIPLILKPTVPTTGALSTTDSEDKGRVHVIWVKLLGRA